MSSTDLIIGRIRGYAAVTGNKDLQGDVIVPGAFRRWLKRAKGAQLPVLYQHDAMSLPIGRTTKLLEDRKGLYYEAEIINTAFGRDALTAIRAGVVSKSSFGWTGTRGLRKDGVRYITQCVPLEVSPVGLLAANPKTSVEIMEAADLVAPEASPRLIAAGR